jgi:beta-glucosidase
MCDSDDGDVEMERLEVDIRDLTLKEKLSLLSGDSLWSVPAIPRLRIPPLILADGPHGVRKPRKELSLQDSYPATCFPTAAALACSWDESLLFDVGDALQKECVHYGVHILLAPGMNLKRHPAGGRNFEYFSEDPILTGRLATAYVQGVQSSGKVAACVKHFAVNNQESHRFVVNAIIDERTARELYYKSFEIAVKLANPIAVMCAYNRINGIYCSENKRLLTDILRQEWGFSGITMTDWGATNNRVDGIRSGMDLEMPGSHGVHYWEIVEALKSGGLALSHIDASTQRMLNLIDEYGSDHNGEPNEYDERNPLWLEHFELAFKVAMDCCVLLKNDDNFLPLVATESTKVAVIGEFAKVHPRYQGMGSSQVHSVKVITAYNELSRYIKDRRNVSFAAGYDADDDHVENVDEALLNDAIEVAREVDVVLLFIGLPEIVESEGFDRDHIGIPAQHVALVERVCEVNENTVVVLSNGGALEMPWHVHPKAILEGYLLGEAGGGAIIDLIFGEQSPCGKLAETFAESVDHILANNYFPGMRDRVEHREGLLVGYRYFDTYQKRVLYPFGHGLSYTTFLYDSLVVTVIQDSEHEKEVEVSLTVQNTGSMSGKEVVQCYVHDMESSVFRPKQELKDFKKILLAPGETEKVRFNLKADAFSFYDIGSCGWIVENGEYEIRVGSSSRDIRLRGTVNFQIGPDKASSLACSSYPPLENFDLDLIDNSTFANRFGDNKVSIFALLTKTNNTECDGFHRNSLLKEVAEKRWLGKILLWVVFKTAAKDVKKGPKQRSQKRLILETVRNLPLRTLVLFSRGGISFDTLDACIQLMNGQVIRALKGFCRSFYHFIRPKR